MVCLPVCKPCPRFLVRDKLQGLQLGNCDTMMRTDFNDAVFPLQVVVEQVVVEKAVVDLEDS